MCRTAFVTHTSDAAAAAANDDDDDDVVYSSTAESLCNICTAYSEWRMPNVYPGAFVLVAYIYMYTYTYVHLISYLIFTDLFATATALDIFVRKAMSQHNVLRPVLELRGASGGLAPLVQTLPQTPIIGLRSAGDGGEGGITNDAAGVKHLQLTVALRRFDDIKLTTGRLTAVLVCVDLRR